MTQEDKELLLLKDLCTRLPYGVKCHFKYGSADGDVTLDCIDNGVARFEYGWYGRVHVSIDADYIKPYLRPMSSMTEEEINEFHKLRFIHVDYGSEPLQCVLSVNEIDWLNAHHFDYRGLIPMGLALEAPEGIYK
jgi:hypothetical protein